MSTFLQLCVKTRQNCMIPGTGPTAVTGQVGELKDIVDWVSDAYVDIQNRHNNWEWLRHGFTLSTTASDGIYAGTDCTDSTTAAAIDRFGSWIFDDNNNPPKIYLTSSGVGAERWLIPSPWHWFNPIYGIGTQNDGQPAHVSIDPQDNLRLGPAPDAAYTVTGEYYRSPQILAADGDTPEMPAQYHDLIVYVAMQKYGMMESAPEVVARGNQEARRLIRALEANQTPRFRLARPMA